MCSMNTSTQFYTIHFLSTSVSVSVSNSVNTPLRDTTIQLYVQIGKQPDGSQKEKPFDCT